MNASTTPLGLSAVRLTAGFFGALAGVGGLTHAFGELRQGPVAPTGLVIDSWVEGPIATHMGGDPAMTVLPTVWAAGVVTLIVSAATVLWAAAFVHRRHGGWVLILLSLGMLVAGGGFGSPIVGVLAGVAGTLIGAPVTAWRMRQPSGGRRVLAGLWPWVFAVAAANGVFLFVGALILVSFFGLGNADLYLGSFFLTVVLLPLTILTGAAHDAELRKHAAPVYG
jgi:hypothetical protein